MPSPDVLDFETLTAPISGDLPTGPYLRSNPDLEKLWWDFSDKLEQERGKEKRILMGEEGAKDATPRWETVASTGANILKSNSKDLWVVAGMIEALTREYSFAGLRDGFRLARELTEKFGNAVHPPLDEDDAADTGVHTAFIRIDGMNSALPDVIRRLPIVNSPNDPPYSTFDHVRITAGRGGDDTPARLDSAARSTPPGDFQAMIDDVSTTIAEIQKLTELADTACGKSSDGLSLAPSLNRVVETLEDSLRRIKTLAGDAGNMPAEEAPSEAAAAGGSGAAPAASVANNAIVTREDAYRTLDKLAAFFDKAEPHSPMAAALRELVSWRTLSFAELMKRLIDDDSARRDLFKRTGVNNNEESN
jgi:type VI secretion system protein ImpA